MTVDFLCEQIGEAVVMTAGGSYNMISQFRTQMQANTQLRQQLGDEGFAAYQQSMRASNQQLAGAIAAAKASDVSWFDAVLQDMPAGTIFALAGLAQDARAAVGSRLQGWLAEKGIMQAYQVLALSGPGGRVSLATHGPGGVESWLDTGSFPHQQFVDTNAGVLFSATIQGLLELASDSQARGTTMHEVLTNGALLGWWGIDATSGRRVDIALTAASDGLAYDAAAVDAMTVDQFVRLASGGTWEITDSRTPSGNAPAPVLDAFRNVMNRILADDVAGARQAAIAAIQKRPACYQELMDRLERCGFLDEYPALRNDFAAARDEALKQSLARSEVVQRARAIAAKVEEQGMLPSHEAMGRALQALMDGEITFAKASLLSYSAAEAVFNGIEHALEARPFLDRLDRIISQDQAGNSRIADVLSEIKGKNLPDSKKALHQQLLVEYLGRDPEAVQHRTALREFIKATVQSLHASMMNYIHKTNIKKFGKNTFMALVAIPHDGGSIVDGISLKTDKYKDHSTRTFFKNNKLTLLAPLEQLSYPEFSALSQSERRKNEKDAEPHGMEQIATRIKAMGLKPGTVVDIFEISWLMFCDGCLVDAIFQKFDLIGAGLVPLLHLDAVEDFPWRWIPLKSDGGEMTQDQQTTFFTRLEKAINDWADAKHEYSLLHGGRTIIEDYQDTWNTIKELLKSKEQNARALIIALLAKRWTRSA